MRLFGAALFFGALWVVLAGYADLSSWIVGIPTIFASIWANDRLTNRKQKGISITGILRLMPIFLLESFKGGIDVSRRVIGRRIDVQPGLFGYQIRVAAPAGRVLFVVLVSLLPGTLSADLQGDHLRVHTLDTGNDAAAELDRLENLVAGCFGESLPKNPRGE
jgi:multicomponent Na+:H+ antiporter subunit E